MTEESFLLVNLKEDKAKKLAQVISNETSRKILDFLTKKKSATETEVSKELQLPISTIHYNLKHLMNAKLIQADEFHYSAKGKEVNHYSLSNKFVIIAPMEPKEKILNKLKKILPVAIIVIAVGFLVEIFQKSFFKTQQIATFAAPRAAEVAEKAVPSAADTLGAAPIVEEAAQEAPQIVQYIQSEPHTTFWFIAGAIFAIIVYVIVDIIVSRRKK